MNNRTSAGDAKVSRPDGTGAGAGIMAQLFLVASDGALTPLLPTTVFRTSSPAAAYFTVPLDVFVPGIPAGSPATFRLRAWEGSDYDVSPLRGESNDVTVPQLGGVPPNGERPVTTPDLAGLLGFTLIARPWLEVSTNAEGKLQMTVQSEADLPGEQVEIERTTDFVIWESVGTASVVNGVVQLPEGNTDAAGAKYFFRVKFL